MKKQDILFWICAAIAALFGMVVTGYGIYLLIRGQDCKSYADLGCAFAAMFSFIIIPYGLVNLAFVGIASLPFKPARLIGSILSSMSGLAFFGLCCMTMMWAFSDETGLVANTELTYFLFPLFLFLGAAAMLGVGVTGFLRSRQS